MAKIGLKHFRKVFSHRLRAFRLIAGYETARAFAKDIEEEENTYTRWERGENMPSVEQLVRICLELGITPHELIWDKNKKSDPKDAFFGLKAEEAPDE